MSSSMAQNTLWNPNSLASDHLGSSTSCINGVPLKHLGRNRCSWEKKNKADFTLVAKLRKGKKHEYPWPKDPDFNVKGGVLTHLSHFKPLKEKQKPVTLEFEKPLLDLRNKMMDVRKMANETGLDFSDQIALLEHKYEQVSKGTTSLAGSFGFVCYVDSLNRRKRKKVVVPDTGARSVEHTRTRVIGMKLGEICLFIKWLNQTHLF